VVVVESVCECLMLHCMCRMLSLSGESKTPRQASQFVNYGTCLSIDQVAKYVSRSNYGKQNNLFVIESGSGLIGEMY